MNARFSILSSLARRVAGVVVCLGAAGDVWGASVEERLQQLEQRLTTLETENAALRRQLGAAESTLVTAGGKEKKLSLGGFIHAQYEGGEAADARFAGVNDRFFLRRARLGATASFVEDVAFKIEADFGNNAISPRTALSGQLTDVFVAWTKFPAISLRAGQFKTPFGFEQLTSDTKTIMLERGLANDRLTLGRQVGGVVFGELAERRLSYSVGAFNGAGTNNGGNDNNKFLWVGRVAATAWDGQLAGVKARASIGTNAFTSEDRGTFSGRRTGWGVDSQFTAGPVELQAEWLRNDLHPATGTPTAATGWSLLGAIYVLPKVQGLLRYEHFDANTVAPRTSTELWTLGFNYLFKGDDLKLSLNYLMGSQPAPTQDGGRLLGRVQVVF